MLLSWIAIISGLALLVWSANRFVIGASALAFNLGVAPMIIGMVIMGFGTSAPEMVVAAVASLGGKPEIAVGNAIGSNIANIALVLGISALISPLTVQSQTLRREFPALFIITGFVFLLMIDGELSRLDGALLLFSTIGMVGWLMWLARKGDIPDPIELEYDSEVPHDMKTAIATLWIIVGLVALVSSSHILVWGAVNVAKTFGVSDLVIGLTIIAIGTSLPEIAVSVTGALKNEHDIAIGNVIGSNMFNMLAVLGVGASIEAAQLSVGVLSRDFLVMLILTIALFFMARGRQGAGRISRHEGFILTIVYVGYLAWLYVSN